MNMTSLPLDILAHQANFSNMNGEYGGLFRIIHGEDYLFYQFQEAEPKGTFGDVKILTFTNPADITGARIYLLSNHQLEQAVMERTPISISKLRPNYQGLEVVERLKKYAHNNQGCEPS